MAATTDPLALARAAGRAAGLAAPPLSAQQATRLRALLRTPQRAAS